MLPIKRYSLRFRKLTFEARNRQIASHFKKLFLQYKARKSDIRNTKECANLIDANRSTGFQNAAASIENRKDNIRAHTGQGGLNTRKHSQESGVTLLFKRHLGK